MSDYDNGTKVHPSDTVQSKGINTTAMVLAAGFGTRLKPLTLTQPKPLIPFPNDQGMEEPLIHRPLKGLHGVGVERFIVNGHYLAPLINSHLNTLPYEFLFSFEKTILETGGGIQKALPLLGEEPFFVTGSDLWWQGNPFQALLKAWNADKMDALLLIKNKQSLFYNAGLGDFSCTDEGLLTLNDNKTDRPYVHTGIQILKPSLFKLDANPDGIQPFPLRDIYRRAQKTKRLYGVVFDNSWADLGTFDVLEKTKNFINNNQ